MRLIDADALKANVPDTSADIFENCRNCKTLMDWQVKELIDQQPTASQWHRVEEELPEKDEWVLTITKSYKGARIYNISTVDSDGRWWTTSYNGMREIRYIEYWMPIEPPKEGQE